MPLTAEREVLILKVKRMITNRKINIISSIPSEDKKCSMYVPVTFGNVLYKPTNVLFHLLTST